MKLGVLLFEGFELLDVFGPLEMLGQIEELSIELVSEKKGAVTSAQGPSAVAEETLSSNACYDIILVPGGTGTRTAINSSEVIKWIAERGLNARYTASVCTGSALLAKAGLLKGKKATTNKLAFSWVCSQAQDTQWIARARWVQDANVFSSAGVSAGIDMSLALIEEIWGDQRARQVADWAEYQWNSNPDHDVFAAKHGL